MSLDCFIPPARSVSARSCSLMRPALGEVKPETRHINNFTVANTDVIAATMRELPLDHRYARAVQMSRYGWRVKDIIAVCAEMRIKIPRESGAA